MSAAKSTSSAAKKLQPWQINELLQEAEGQNMHRDNIKFMDICDANANLYRK